MESASAPGSPPAHAPNRRAPHRKRRAQPSAELVVELMEIHASLLAPGLAPGIARGNRLQRHMLLLPTSHANHRPLGIVGLHGFGVSVLEFRLRAIECKQTIRSRSQPRRNETPIGAHPDLGELPAAVRQRNAVDMCRGRPAHRGIRSPAPCAIIYIYRLL